MSRSSRAEILGTSRFDVVSRLGEGGSGIVYEAVDRETGARVAVKTLRSMTPETLLVLKNEFRSVADLHHPNLVQLGELFEEGGQWFLTMEFVGGTDFIQHVCPGEASGEWPALRGAPPGGRKSRYDEGRLRHALRQLVSGLSALHAAGKVHRDVKPSNVLVTPEGRVVILDFGVASDFARESRRTSAGLAGTVLYMAPEQIACEDVGPAADWYAVGVVLYRALTGRHPFEGHAPAIMEQKLVSEPPAPRFLAPGIPEDLDLLCEELLRTDPIERPTGPEILERLRSGEEPAPTPSSQPRLQSAFIGRRKELRQLEHAYADSRRGEAVSVLVEGESGVGKTYFVRRFTDRILADERPPLVLVGRCYERESVPYKAIDGLVDDLCLYLRDLTEAVLEAVLPPQIALLADVFPVMKQVELVAALAAQPREPLNAQESRARMFLALRELLARIASQRPLVLVIDDLQWADADSRALLTEILRTPRSPQLLLVATQRRGAGHGTSAEWLPGDVRTLDLSRLTPKEARELAFRLLGPTVDATSAADIQAIAAESGGHPMFIEELVRQRDSGRAPPGSLRLDDALWARVMRLEPAARHLLEAVTIAGIPIAQEAAAHAAAVDFGQLLPLMASLRAGHFVKTTGSRKEDSVEPYHDRVREAVLSHLDEVTRRDWHGRLALSLERAQDKADPEALAVHWREAGQPSRAVEYAVLAAERASASLAFERAVRLYRMALELYGKDDETSHGLRLKLAEALTNAGHNAQAADVRLALASSANASTSLELRRQAAEQLLCSGYFDRGVEVLEEVLRVASAPAPRSLPMVLVVLLMTRFLLALRGLRYTERDPSQVPVPERMRVDATFSAGLGFAMTDNVRGAYFQSKNLLFALRAGDPSRVHRGLAYEVCFSSGEGTKSQKRTRRLLEACDALATRLGTPYAIATTSVARGWQHYMLGEWALSREWIGRGETIFRDQCVGVGFQLQTSRLMLFRVLVYMGRLTELAERVAPVLREVESQGDLYSEIGLRAGPLLMLGLAADEPSRVRTEVEHATARLPRSRFVVQNYFCFLGRGQVDLYAGEGKAAYARILATWPALRRSMLLRLQIIRILAWEQRARAAIAAAQGEAPERARTLLRAAEQDAARIERERVPWCAPFGPMIRAGVASSRGEKERALALLAEAADGFERVAMGLHAAAATWTRGCLLGNEAGAPLVARAEAFFEEQGVKSPIRMSAMLVPGFAS